MNNIIVYMVLNQNNCYFVQLFFIAMFISLWIVYFITLYFIILNISSVVKEGSDLPYLKKYFCAYIAFEWKEE